MIHAKEGQPAVGSPNTNFRIIINITKQNAKNREIIPNELAKTSGLEEKAVIPSME